MIEFDVFSKNDKSPDMTPMIDMVFFAVNILSANVCFPSPRRSDKPA